MEVTNVVVVDTGTFTRTVTYQAPGEGVDSVREFKFVAKYRAMPQDDWEELCATSTKFEALKAVLVSAEGMRELSMSDGSKLPPLESALRDPFACDAAFAEYTLFTTRNSRQAAKSAAEEKNSKRSRGR